MNYLNDAEDGKSAMRIASLEGLADALDAFALYIKFYIQYHIKANGLADFDTVMSQIITCVQAQITKGERLF